MTKKFKEIIAQSTDELRDLWEEKTSNQTSRTGTVTSRIASLLANEVAPEVIALQMTMNSEKANPKEPSTFTGDDVIAYAKLHHANRTRSILPQHQTGALIRAQRDSNTDLVPDDGEPEPA